MRRITDKCGMHYLVARRHYDAQTIIYKVSMREQLVARAVLQPARGSVSDVLVWPDWRRRGIASALYRLIEADLGRALIPGRIKSSDGKAFWAHRSVV